MDLAAFEWLPTRAGQTLLAVAESLHRERVEPIRAGEILRARAAPDRAAAAMTQAVLREAATAKFGPDARRMYFTPDGLEQATRRRVSGHRAARIALARPESVLDLGCGIGGDLVALASAGLTAAGVDLDPVRVAVAAANLRALDLPGAVLVADGTELDLDPFGVVFADPSRRGVRGRVFDPDAYVPSWSFVEGLLRRPSCVKVAPGLPHERIPAGVEAEWVSEGGEVKEAVLWSPHLATAARRATLIRPGGLVTLTTAALDDHHRTGAGSATGAASGAGARVRPVGRYLYEPDGAVSRAGLVGSVAELVGGGLVDDHIAYLTGDELVGTPYARAYEVLEQLPYRERQLRAALRARGVGRLTIKKRGVEVVPEELRRRLDLRGDAEATIVLTRTPAGAVALLVTPVVTAAS